MEETNQVVNSERIHPSEVDLALDGNCQWINPELVESYERFEAYWADRKN